MYSAEGEEVELSFSIYPSSNVEDWLREVEHSMKASVRSIIERAIQAYPKVSTALHPPGPHSVPLSLLPASSSGFRPTTSGPGRNLKTFLSMHTQKVRVAPIHYKPH